MIIAEKYEVLGELGRGGMGVVYQIRHLELGSIFAMKMLRPELIEAEETVGAMGRFYNEARVMARLRHPHVIQVFDIDQEQGRPYFVMEFVQGRSLHEILQKESPLPLPRVLAIGAQVGQALAYAHAQQPPVIHRDIKPHNIMLEDGTGRVVVLDFGIAKLLDRQKTHYTRTGAFIGTVAYSSPEQLRGDATLDGRTDLFSLGLVMYEMVAGRRFFADLSKEAIIGKQLYERGDYKPEFERPVPKAFRRLITKTIAKDRDRRYDSVAEWLDALAKVPVTRWGELARAVSMGGVVLAALAALAWIWESPWRGEITRFIERRLASTFPVSPPPSRPSPGGERPPQLDQPTKAAENHPLPALRPIAPTEPPVAIKSTETQATRPPVQPVAPPAIHPPVAAVEAPKSAPPLPVTPPAGRIALKACETQVFAVNDDSSGRYAWWIDGQRQPEEGRRLRFAGHATGQHTVRVAASGDEVTGANWEVSVSPAPPSETEARQWLEAYRRALEAGDLNLLRELGYVRSDSQAVALQEKFRTRTQNQVQIQDWQAEAQGNEVQLSFQQADHWRDPATRSLVVDYSSQNVTLVRPNCSRIVAR